MRWCVVVVCVSFCSGCADDPPSASDTLQRLTLALGDEQIEVNELLEGSDAFEAGHAGTIHVERIEEPDVRLVSGGSDDGFILLQLRDFDGPGDYVVGDGEAVELRWTGLPGGRAVGGTITFNSANFIGIASFSASFHLITDDGEVDGSLSLQREF